MATPQTFIRICFTTSYPTTHRADFETALLCDTVSLHGTSISHLLKRKGLFPTTLWRGCWIRVCYVLLQFQGTYNVQVPSASILQPTNCPLALNKNDQHHGGDVEERTKPISTRLAKRKLKKEPNSTQQKQVFKPLHFLPYVKNML